MGITDKRVVFKPFEYPEFYEAWVKAQSSHWTPFEVDMGQDVIDWRQSLSESEKNVIGNILKSFTVAEVIVEDYWASKVGRWFKKPEIQMLAHTFSAWESIHSAAYDHLNATLGLTDYTAFLSDEASKAKLDRLLEVKGKSKTDMLRSLAVFSGFFENVQLFSSFVVLMSFSKRNLLKGVGQIIAWSSQDEASHATNGLRLFNILKSENQELWTDELKKDIYDAARLSIKLEDDFLDKVFELGDIEGVKKDDVKAYMRHRANLSLKEMGLKPNWTNVNKEAVDNISSWFDVMVFGTKSHDFFAGKDASYAKDILDFGEGVW